MSTTTNNTTLPPYHTIGSRYADTADLDIAGIAKLVRADIKATVKAGHLPADVKYSVRIERYSMGQSLHVTAKLADRPARERIDVDYPGQYGYTHEAKTMSAILHSIVDAYNYDNSDSMTDYYNVRFYCTPQIDGTRED